MENQTLVSLDLETTGLDSEKDRIIEIGAVKFRGRKVLETFHTLVDPGCPLSYRIRLLTGITSEELQAAPAFPEVAEGLRDFIGDHPILGQNISFDLEFLRIQGLSFSNPVYDTFEITNVLLPQLQDFSLASMARELCIPNPIQHRALADAHMVKEVLLSLMDRAAELELPLVVEINRLTAASNWPWRSMFLDLERGKVGEASLWDREAWSLRSVPQALELPEREPLAPAKTLKPLDIDRLGEFLSEDGLLAEAFPGFEYRPGQVAMMKEVAGALNGKRHAIIEAGTGIGKSIAYLLPAVTFAVRNSRPVVVSTNTINLQEQLTGKDIPELLGVLNQAGNSFLDGDLRIAQLKGRSNYLCLRRWNNWRKTPGLAWEEARFLLRLLLWVYSTASGDRAELSITGSDAALWHRVCASEENCVVKRCPHHPDGCFLYRARHKAEGAHLIVVNHALLLSDLANGGILPDYGCLVVDEAHHLEDEATEQLGFKVADQDLRSYLDRLGDKGGFLFYLRSYLRTASAGASRKGDIRQRSDSLVAGTKRARSAANELIDALTRFLGLEIREDQRGYEQRLRLTGALRHQPGWAEVEGSWEDLDLELENLESGLSELCAMMENLPDRRDPDLNSSLGESSYLLQQVRGIRSQMNAIVVSPEPHYVYWASIRSEGALCLHAAPVHVGSLLSEPLFLQKDTVVLTSATLSTDGNFDYVRNALGLEAAAELIVEPPFDYVKSTMIYLPQDIPEPDRAGYQHCVAEALVGLCRATRGRTLALFTSHSGLRTAYKAVDAALGEEGILVMGQGLDGSPRKLLARFKDNPESLLMGTAAFWEGVDVVGPGLSVLVIARLPFGVPNDPVFSARAELFDDPFNEYMVPQAILRFKQGFGRLIRSRNDRGAVVVLDRRLQSKSYGRAFLQSLPKCTVRTGPLRDMPQEVVRWLGE
jgi:predicted DnaQ family exonuclease/DinG family helicase